MNNKVYIIKILSDIPSNIGIQANNVLKFLPTKSIHDLGIGKFVHLYLSKDLTRSHALREGEITVDEYNHVGKFIDLSYLGLGYGNFRRLLAGNIIHENLPILTDEFIQYYINITNLGENIETIDLNNFNTTLYNENI